MAGTGVAVVLATAAVAQASGGGDGFLRPFATATPANTATSPTAVKQRKIEQGGTVTAPSSPSGVPANKGPEACAAADPGAGQKAGQPAGGGQRRLPAQLSVRVVGSQVDRSFNQARDINDAGVIVGSTGSGTARHPSHGWRARPPYRQRDVRGFDVAGAAQTQDAGINRAGAEVGFFVGKDGATSGFVRVKGDVSVVRYPRRASRPANDKLLGISNRGVAAGYYDDDSGNSHGYLYGICERTFSAVRIPVPADSVRVTGVNDAGTVTGFFRRGKVTRGFVLGHGRFTLLRLGNDTETRALGIGNRGEVVGSFADRNGRTHGFVWSPRQRLRTVDVARASSTVVHGLNDRGQIVGSFTTRNHVTAGFLAS